jgi:XTP/dITP diphosphohydrolase
MDLVEPQFDSVLEVAKYKAKQAFDIVKKPVFVCDAGFSIEELDGFPGAYAKYFNDTIGNDGYLRLMKDKENRKCFYTTTIVYIDESGKEHSFESHINAKMTKEEAKEINGEAWSDLWKITILEGSVKTIAELSEDERTALRDKRGSDTCWIQFLKIIK